MAIQTELKQEKEFFDALKGKIKKSKKIGLSKVKNPKTNRSDIYRWKFDTFTLDLIYGKNDLDNNNYTLDTNTCVYFLTVYDKSGKKVTTIDCTPYDVEGDALKLQVLRNTMAGEILSTIETRVEKEKEKKEREKQKQEELKKAAERVKKSKKLRAQQQKDAVALAGALKKVQGL